MENKDIPKSFEELMAEEYGLTTIKPRPVEEVKYRVYSGTESLEEYKRLQEKYGEGVTTGFSQLNEFFRYLPGQIYLLSASTHVGKTMFALNMSAYISMTGKKVLYISLEQGVFVASLLQKIIGEKYPETFSVLDTTEMVSVPELLVILNGLSEHYDLIVIDHIHFLKKTGRGATEDIDEVIHGLQNLAKELEVPLLVIAHLRKLNSNKPPTMDDLRDSSSLSQVPSVVMMLHRDENKDTTLQEQGVLFIRKNRIQGKTGALPFMIAEKVKIYFSEQDYMATTVEQPPTPTRESQLDQEAIPF